MSAIRSTIETVVIPDQAELEVSKPDVVSQFINHLGGKLVKKLRTEYKLVPRGKGKFSR